VNRRRRNYLRDQRTLENCLPLFSPEKSDLLQDFLDEEADSTRTFDQERFFLLLDLAPDRPLPRKRREEIGDLLLKFSSGSSKLRLVGLIRDALGNLAKRKAPAVSVPEITDPITHSILRDMLP